MHARRKAQPLAVEPGSNGLSQAQSTIAAEIARYAKDSRELADRGDLKFLAYLLDMVASEAEECLRRNMACTIINRPTLTH